uniref:Cell division cycle 16 homolog (S. cerevisiae) n=1 Tax=Eptatretus burgeri TaxID=7764 RepID=A0A8C4N4F7_EPTBU
MMSRPQHQYQSALFWADKVACLSQEDVKDVYRLAQCHFLMEQYHRAAHLLRSRNLDKVYHICRYLAAKCHFALREYELTLEILDKDSVPGEDHLFDTRSCQTEQPDIDADTSPSVVFGAMCLLRGRVYDALDNRLLATQNYQKALNLDPYCFEALDCLTGQHMLTAQEESDLLNSLPLNLRCSAEEAKLVQFLYESKLKKYDKPQEVSLPGSFTCLSNNLDVRVATAERHYYNCDFRSCYKITSQILKEDPFNAACLPIHVGTLVELFKKIEIFYLAHKLVDLYPNNPVSWFAVGCYYLLVGQKHEHARRYLSKATTLNRMFGPAWIAYGHSFAVEGEHDQAMAAYFTSAQLMKGCHLPLLYIGLEYGLTNNPRLAERFFSQALSIAPEDPFALHEMGVVAFHNQDWEGAYKFFVNALKKVKAIGDEVTVDKWEPLFNNLGHVCRKLKRYDEALEYHRQALVLAPQNASTFAALGFIHSLTCDFHSAIDYFHKALGLRRDDTFSVTMLGNCIERYLAEDHPSSDWGLTVEMDPSLPLSTTMLKILTRSDATQESQAQQDALIHMKPTADSTTEGVVNMIEMDMSLESTGQENSGV